MAERRTLAEGLDTVATGDRTAEEQFVYGKKPPRGTPATAKHVVASAPPAAPVTEHPARAAAAPRPAPMLGLGRVPVGARIRTELAAALKRASLERQLQGVEPNSIQDILEEALAPWLERHGYLP